MKALLLINELTAILDQAVERQNWAQIASADERIALLLASLAGQPRSSQQALAMKHLQETHLRACQYCWQARQQLKEEMLGLRDRQEGVSAYAAMIMTAEKDRAIEGDIR